MSDGRCTTCGKWRGYSHRCPPAFLVWNAEEGLTEEDATVIYAYDAELAAEEWAEEDDANSADYCILKGSEPTVFVKEQGSEAPPKKFRVTGEAVPQYHATEIE